MWMWLTVYVDAQHFLVNNMNACYIFKYSADMFKDECKGGFYLGQPRLYTCITGVAWNAFLLSQRKKYHERLCQHEAVVCPLNHTLVFVLQRSCMVQLKGSIRCRAVITHLGVQRAKIIRRPPISIATWWLKHLVKSSAVSTSFVCVFFVLILDMQKC